MAGQERISVKHRNEELSYLNPTNTFHIFIDRRTDRRYNDKDVSVHASVNLFLGI